MKIYITHSTSFDFKNELYKPLRNSDLNKVHEIILPHENSDTPTNSKELIKNFDLIIAEVSYPSTGQGIELGWVDSFKIPIVCIYKKGETPSAALYSITYKFIEYNNAIDMINKLSNQIQ